MPKYTKSEVAEAREFLARYLFPAEGEDEKGIEYFCTECHRRIPVVEGAMEIHHEYKNPEASATCAGSGQAPFEREWSRRRVDKKGATVYQSVTHVAKSGMSRSITNMVIVENEPVKIDWAVARVLGESCDQKNGGVKVSGCGMDMGFHIVNYLSYAMHGHHSAHPLAGYTLEHRWL